MAKSKTPEINKTKAATEQSAIDKRLEEINVIQKVATAIESKGLKDRQMVKDYASMIDASARLGELGMMLEYADKCCSAILRLPKDEIKMTSVQNTYWYCMRMQAPFKFEPFMLYLESERPREERFYQNRMNPLNKVAQAVQDLRDNKLDELFVNLPPRVGKTTIARLAFVWFGSGDTERSNLYSAYSDTITKMFYNGINEFMADPTYTYKKIYPQNKIVASSAEYETYDLNRKKAYPTFTCRSILGTLNGACDCSGLLLSDDLLSGIEEAMSQDRLASLWSKVDNNLIPRAKEGAKMMHIGTRWATLDPQGRRQQLLSDDPAFRNRRSRIISIPALGEEDKSNFDYAYGVGFSSEYYKMRRASFDANGDEASWLAQYQQEPVDRYGAIFSPENMKFYNGVLPSDTPDRIFMAIDEAFGGGDYVSAPICYQFGEEFYIHDVVFDNGDKDVTRPRIAQAIIDHKVAAARFEETRTTYDYHEWISQYLEAQNVNCNIQTQAPGTRISKIMRIVDKAPEIRRFYFRDVNCRSVEYNRFMKNVYDFKTEGKVKHDDAPDSLAQLCGMIVNLSYGVQLIDSPF